ncbi:MAG: sigma-54-dependent transcriptional regulator [Pseudomonadota bacterium]|jgi:two-component system, NtrC family, response regulator GlrR
MNNATVLLVDDDPGLLQLLEIRLESFGYKTLSAASGEEALELLENNAVQVLITDLRMEPMDGIELFARVRDRWPSVPVIMITAHGTIREAVDATVKGVFSFLTKPVDPGELQSVLKKAVSLNPGSQVAASPVDGRLITRSARMLELLEQARLYAESDANLLLTGESGTGKELLAEFIHAHSSRAGNPFVAINCSAIPNELLESELFGHVRGAFTGADRNRQGLFAAAHGGTVLLDEIGDMPIQLQAKLLRVLQEGKVRPLGASEHIDIDIRVISATHVDLESSIVERRFREDLFYRINVVGLHIPPLRERREDIPLLADFFLSEIARRTNKPEKRLSAQALGVLLGYDWPGNVRQLQNVIERLFALSRGPVIPEDLVQQALPVDTLPRIRSLSDARRNFERQYLIHLLSVTNGNMTQAAELADRNRSDLHKLVRRHAINPADFRSRGAEGN